VAAQAQPVDGIYVGAGVGLNWLQETDIEASGTLADAIRAQGGSPGGDLSFDLGWVGVISLGYGFGNGVRAEIEGSYRENEVDKIKGFGQTVGAEGKSRSYGVMVNGFYDFDLGLNLGPVSFMPYIGAGIGYIWREFDDVSTNVVLPAGGGGQVRTSGTDGRFAYQAILGAAMPINDVPGLAVTAEYRFLGTLEHDIDTTSSGGGFEVSRGGTKSENYNHSLLLGIRYAFNQAPPPPPPVAAPAPAAAPAVARTYLVFFDFDRADLTDRARQIISEAAQNSRRVSSTRIEVAGHADRAGSVQYNQRLSQRRADAVAAELVSQGVSRNDISISAYGETRPLVPTADGVREPQNRRVEIVLR
jgi:outer membrane protein OmpA-like peptidoglycan-associated protein